MKKICIAACLFVGTCVYAENEVVSLSLSPKVVRVNDVITATIETSLFPLETSTVIWSVDGKTLTQGIGTHEIAFTVKDTKPHMLKAHITEKTGIAHDVTTSVQASRVDIVWEAETLTPPWYRGRALPTLQSTIRAEVFAPSHNRDTLIYTWTADGKVLPSASGQGKYGARYTFPMFVSTVLLGVRVENSDGEYVGETSVRITSRDPIVHLYELKPLLGPWFNTTVRATTLTENAPIVFAYPYYMSARTLADSALSYTLSTSGTHDTTEQPYAIVLKNISPGAAIEAVVSHKQKLLQEGLGRDYFNESVESISPFEQ